MTDSPGKGVYAQFTTSVTGAQGFPGDGLPEVALVGRSNVGKSSLINTLFGNPKLARTSGQPGRTRTLNFYRIWPDGVPAGEAPPAVLTGADAAAARAARAFYLVDMPGYGYARVPKTMKAAWSRLIEGYLRDRAQLQSVIQIVDFRHTPTPDDVQMWDWLRHYEKPRLLVATKLDKIGRSHWHQRRRTIEKTLHLGQGEGMLLFSAETSFGRDDLWNWILERSRTPASGQG